MAKMLSGIMQPAGGEILIDGISPQQDRRRVVKNLGVMSGQPHAELISVNEIRDVYRFRKDEISAAQLTGDISHTAPIKEVGLEEAKIDDIIRTAYRQGNSAGERLEYEFGFYQWGNGSNRKKEQAAVSDKQPCLEK